MNFLYTFYLYVNKRKALFIGILLFIVAFSLFFGYKIRLKEDVTEMMPKDEHIEKISKILRSAQFSDKIIFNVYLTNSDTTDPALLVDFTAALADSLRQYNPGLIKEIREKVPEDAVYSIFSTVFDNLPVFLRESDYEKLDSLMEPANIEHKLASNFKALVSPASVVLKKFVVADPLGLSGSVLKKLKDLQFAEEYMLYNQRIFTKNQKNLLFFVIPSFPANETGKNEPLIEHLDEKIAQVEKAYGGKVKAEYFGAVPVSVGNATRIKSDIAVTVTLAAILLVTFMSLFFRRITVVLIIFLPVVLGGIVSLGMLYFIRGSVSAIALGMGSVLLGITVDYSLHLFTHYRSTGSIKSVYADLPGPLILSCLITAASFLCLLFVKSDALKDLGWFSAISVVNALIFALLILPHFFRKKDYETKLNSFSFIDKYTSYEFDRSRLLIIAMVVITVVAAFSIPKVAFETDMMKMNYVSDKLYKAEKHLQKITSLSLRSVYIVSSGENLQEALQENEKVAEIVSTLKEKKLVQSSSAVSDFILSDSLQKLRIQKWESYWTSEKKEKIKTLLSEEGKKYKFRKAAFTSFFALLDKDFRPVSQEDMGAVKKLLFDDFITEKPGFSTVVTLLKVDDKDKEKVLASIPESEHVTLIDKKYITNKFVQLLSNDFNTLEVLSLGLVFIVLILCYGRIELGIIAFVPMILSWVWTLGIMGLFGIKFNIVNIIISTFILGLGIDYSIFIMSGLTEAYKKGVNHLATYKTSIFLSAFTSISGIGALIFAQHPALKSVAALSIIGMTSIITISYTIQPLLYRKLITERAAKGLYPYTAKNLLLTLFAYNYFLSGCLLLTSIANLVLPFLPLSMKVKKKVFHRLLSSFCKSQVYIMGNVQKEIINTTGEAFAKPAIIICNHTSFLDILLTLMLSPKIVLVTNDWVWNSPIFGKVVKYAGFFPASKGIMAGIDDLKKRIEEGFSIVIFPEGTRSKDGKIGRFHKGAFYLAEQLQVDILPILIHGAADTIAKNDFMLKNGRLTLKMLPRISPDNERFGNTYQEKTKHIAPYFKAEYGMLRQQIENPEYYREKLIRNYIYKSPVLEWYMRIKLKLEANYTLFNQLLPLKGKIVDIGCGYGFMNYMLSFLSEERLLTGIDYDEEKIEVAKHCFSKNERLNFITADIKKFELPEADAFVLSDVLHYLPAEEQENLLNKCFEKLNEGGVIIVRDGNKDYKKRHRGTRLTELFSTKILAFNKTVNTLSYVSGDYLTKFCKEKNMDVQIVDNTKLTSNFIYIIRRSGVLEVHEKV